MPSKDPRYRERYNHRTRAEYLRDVLASCGSESAYNRGCRCERCREAARVGRADRRAATRRACALERESS